MKVHYHVSSSKIDVRKWYATKEEAISAYEHRCKKEGIEPPWNYPGRISGDLHERLDNGGRIQGPRDGHGNVYVEWEYQD